VASGTTVCVFSIITLVMVPGMAVTVTVERNNCYSASKDQQMNTVRRCSVRPMSCVC